MEALVPRCREHRKILGNTYSDHMTNEIEAIAQKIAGALMSAEQIAAPSSEGASLSVNEAYVVASRVRNIQQRKRIGRKVGFTNRSIWPIYGVDQPIWGEVHAESMFAPDQRVPLASYMEPRIEPEIVLGLGKAPAPDMSAAELANCVDWIAPGFEVVHSIYPGWKFSVGDSIAAQALHGCLVVGDRIPASAEALSGLAKVPLELLKGTEVIETGKGENALGGPLEVLSHLVSLLADQDALQAGELVTTGTLTDAWPVEPGQRWRARYGGVMNAELSVQFV